MKRIAILGATGSIGCQALEIVDSHPELEFAVHWLNFLTPPIEALRAPLFFGTAPPAADTIYTAVAAVVALALGAFVFSRSDDRIAVEV